MEYMMKQSIADRINQTGGRTSGFDYLRIFLAVSVIAIHSTSISYGRAYDATIWTGLAAVFAHSILPIFFALSGFLVAGSLERCPTLVSFYGLRTLRIVPALFVEVMLSAIIFGPMLSTMDLASYFSAPEFRLYFLNIIGDIHYLLPGVFTNNPLPATVNGQLWTVPFELECYVALGALIAVGITSKRKVLLGVIIFGQCLWAWEAYKRGNAGELAPVNGPVLVLSFLSGFLFFLYRDLIILSKSLFILATTACVGLLLLQHGAFLVAIPATYITVYLGLLNPPKIKYLLAGDYSYGLYLYGYPIQQAFASMGSWAHHWYLNLAVSLSAAFVIAYMSWNYIEKPTLALRRYLPEIERKFVAFVYGAWGTIRALVWEDVVTKLLSLAIFGTGIGSAMLLLDAHGSLGLISALMCFTLGVMKTRYRRFAVIRLSGGKENGEPFVAPRER